MDNRPAYNDFKQLLSGKAWLIIWLPIILISVAHFTTSAYHHWLHDILRRLYYIPIILGAFSFGIKGALSASLFASLLYAPHAFTQFLVQDPTTTIEKLLEIMLYNIVGIITGTLAEREKTQRIRQEKVSHRLRDSMDEMKLLEEQLIRAGRLQALGELTAGLAHEIKNPLASIKGASEIISDEIATHSPKRAMVGILKKELERLETLLEKFLSFAKLEDFEIVPLEPCKVAEHVVSLTEAEARKRGVNLSYRCSTDGMRVEGNREHLSQILLNLILNAIEVSPDNDEVEIDITRATKGKTDFVAISVIDHGPGVPDEIREKIFNPFFTSKADGLGLGLSIASRIADGHHGFIETKNRSGGGASFTLYLPLKPD
jgi:two-component system, NtrC family, sensor histidine kinase HydH